MTNFGAQMIGQAPADDAAGAEVDDDGEVEPALGGGNVSDIAHPDLIRRLREGFLKEEIGRRLIGSSITGPRHEGFGLERAQAALGHEAAEPGWRANDALVSSSLARRR